MNIRKKLTFQFSIIVILILILFSAAIYYSSATYRKDVFSSRLKDRAITTMKLLIEVKEVDSLLLRIIDKNTMVLFDESIRIYNYKNEEIYTSNDNDTTKISLALLNNIRLHGEVYQQLGEKEMLGLNYSQYPKNYVVIATALDKYGLKKLVNLRIILFIGLLASFIITVISGMFYAGRALRPIKKVISQAKKITASQLSLRLDTGNGTDEIAKLSITFNEMLKRLEASFELQKTFVSNASHEFRTPFALILCEIELALNKERTNEELIETLHSISEDVKNLNKLSNGLLELTQANLDTSAFQFKPLRMDELLLQTRIDLLKRNHDFTVNIDFVNLPEDEKYITINGNENLLKTAFLNLMNNACKFSDNKTVMISFKFFHHTLQISFADNGIGIPKKEIPKIFEPFFRGSNVGVRQGHGLGLPLVYKIISLHKGTVNVTSVVNKGSAFTVILPSA